jgi:hypothetical protein
MTVVQVLPIDILAGRPIDPAACPIARAVSRAMGRDMHASAGGIGDFDCWSPLPPIAREFIWRFDRGLPVTPIIFIV